MNSLHRAIALTVLAALSACSAEPTPSTATPTPVRTAEARLGPSLPRIATNGLVVTKDETRLSFKVGGIVRQITVEPGDAVKKGQRLAEIELTEVNAQVEQARQMATKAQRDLARGENLYRDEVISLEQLQDLRTQAAMAKAQLDGASYNLSYAAITSPQDGVVLRKLVEVREIVPAGQPVLIIGSGNRGYVVKSALADREIVQLTLGDRAEIRMDAFPGETVTGKVSEIASGADPANGLFPVEVRLDTPPPGVVSGLVAKLAIQPSRASDAQLTYVPIAAIVEGDGDRASVFIAKDGKAQRRDVKVAFIGPDSVALASGVSAGEPVVTEGALYLEDGERITVVTDTRG